VSISFGDCDAVESFFISAFFNLFLSEFTVVADVLSFCDDKRKQGLMKLEK
jgi:hypothetical protein